MVEPTYLKKTNNRQAHFPQTLRGETSTRNMNNSATTYLRTFQHTTETYPEPKTPPVYDSRILFIFGVLVFWWGMLQGFVGIVLEILAIGFHGRYLFKAIQQKQTASTLLPETSRMLVDSSFRPSPRQKQRQLFAGSEPFKYRRGVRLP